MALVSPKSRDELRDVRQRLHRVHDVAEEMLVEVQELRHQMPLPRPGPTDLRTVDSDSGAGLTAASPPPRGPTGGATPAADGRLPDETASLIEDLSRRRERALQNIGELRVLIQRETLAQESERAEAARRRADAEQFRERARRTDAAERDALLRLRRRVEEVELARVSLDDDDDDDNAASTPPAS